MKQGYAGLASDRSVITYQGNILALSASIGTNHLAPLNDFSGYHIVLVVKMTPLAPSAPLSKF